MASHKNRRTLKRQSKRVKGGDGMFSWFSSTPQPQNATAPAAAPASTGSSWLSPSTWSIWTKQTTPQAGQGQVNQGLIPPKGGKRMRKTSKRQSR